MTRSDSAMEAAIRPVRSEDQVGVEAVDHRLIDDDEKRQRYGGRDQARHDALDDKWPANEPLGRADQLHDLDLFSTVINSGSNRVHDDHDRDDDKDRHQPYPRQAKPGGKLEHAVDEVALIVGGIGWVDTRPPPTQQIDGRDILEVDDPDVELGVQR